MNEFVLRLDDLQEMQLPLAVDSKGLAFKK